MINGVKDTEGFRETFLNGSRHTGNGSSPEDLKENTLLVNTSIFLRQHSISVYTLCGEIYVCVHVLVGTGGVGFFSWLSGGSSVGWR